MKRAIKEVLLEYSYHLVGSLVEQPLWPFLCRIFLLTLEGSVLVQKHV